jgi:hypothetical protein
MTTNKIPNDSATALGLRAVVDRDGARSRLSSAPQRLQYNPSLASLAHTGQRMTGSLLSLQLDPRLRRAAVRLGDGSRPVDLLPPDRP